MVLDLIARAAALITVLGTAVVYGTDVFCAIVLRPALASVDDDALVAVTGSVHRYGDRRMPVPWVLGFFAAAVSAVLAGVTAHWTQAIAAGAALVLLLVWLVLYTQVSAPVNRQLTAAADAGKALPNGRVLQAKWDSNHRRSRDAARSGSGRPMRGADDLTRPCPWIHTSRHQPKEHSIRCFSSGSTPCDRPKLCSSMRWFTGPATWQPSRHSGSPPTVCGPSEAAARIESSR